jgi:hypothetical protein
MKLPEWVVPFKEPHTAIKLIKGGYYKYEVSYRYDPSKKRTIPISGVLLGKITEDGFIPSGKHILRTKQEVIKVDIKTFGVYAIFETVLKEEIQSLREVFGSDIAEGLLFFAMMRWAYQTPIKRVLFYQSHDYSSEQWNVGVRLSDKYISSLLKFVGENREMVLSWLRIFLPSCSDNFVLMDSTHIMSSSGQLAVNAKGYNGTGDFGKQVRLMYLFQAKLSRPIYYRLVNGNITDISSMFLCVKELDVKQVVFIADKGFYSYKTFMKADVMYMQNRYVLEGWLFANFLAMLAYYKLYNRLRETELITKNSPKDIIEMAKSVYLFKINGEWKRSEVSQKTMKLFEKIKIDSLT